MDDRFSEKWQRLVDSFGIKKPGTNPWDAELLDQQMQGASHGEKCTIQFLLNLWNAGHQWQCGQFDFFDAISTWGVKQRQAFIDWATDPWRP